MNRTTKLFSGLAIGLASIVMVTGTAPGQASTSGKITIESKSIALGVGVSWGDGTLLWRGKKYPFSVEGLSVLDLGVSKVTAHGEVVNLKRLEDFEGNYVAAGAGATVGGGGAVVALKNQNGVEMALIATTQGVKFALAGAGVSIKLKK